jgi:hypothetical protein
MTKTRSLLLPAILFFAVGAMAAGAPRIISITPASGLVSGGDAVTIAVQDLPFDCSICSPPYAVGVTFDGVDSKDVRIMPDGSSVTAIAPPHASGKVDVTVSNQFLHVSATAAAGFTYSTRFDDTTVEGILVPSVLATENAPLPGAGGSQWVSELFVRNGSLVPVPAFLGDQQCLSCDPPSLPPVAEPGLVVQLQGQGPNVPTNGALPAHMLYVQRSEASSFAFSLRVRDISHATANDGTELPVVREAQLTNRPVELLNVPLNSTSRAALRLFATTTQPSIEPVAYVTVTSMTNPQIGGFVRVALAQPQYAGYGNLLRAPGYATINDLKSQLNLPDGRYMVEIAPQTYTGWAFMSVTNNATQLVTAIGPN